MARPQEPTEEYLLNKAFEVDTSYYTECTEYCKIPAQTSSVNWFHLVDSGIPNTFDGWIGSDIFSCTKQSFKIKIL